MVSGKRRRRKRQQGGPWLVVGFLAVVVVAFGLGFVAALSWLMDGDQRAETAYVEHAATDPNTGTPAHGSVKDVATRISDAFRGVEGKNSERDGTALRAAIERRKADLRYADMPSESVLQDQITRATAWAKSNYSLLAAATCADNDWLDKLSFCVNPGDRPQSKLVRTSFIGTDVDQTSEDEVDSEQNEARKLDGAWRGPDTILRVDGKRNQASTDPARPFHWDRFIVKSVSPDKITFSIGPEIYHATINTDEMSLTSTSFRGERLLKRSNPVAQ